MRVQHNISAAASWRLNSEQNRASAKSVEKLSSGQRINIAADDAAGLAISEKMRNQIRGLSQGQRNTQDGISLLQTAEGGLQEVHAMLARGRDLAVQAANDTMTASDRQKTQNEVLQLLKEIDNVANGTKFNTKNLLNTNSMSVADQQALIDELGKSMLYQAEQLISSQYGLTASGLEDLKIVLDPTIDGAGGTLAYVSYWINSTTHHGTGVELHVDVKDFLPVTAGSNGGGSAPYWNDRIIAHEMVHAVMSQTMNMTPGAIPTWFKEGTAEFIHGADERLRGDLSYSSVSQVVSQISGSWGGNSLAYSGGYAAVRYMHDKIQEAGGTGIQDVMNYLSQPANQNKTLADALADATVTSGAFSGMADFTAKFQGTGVGSGQEWINTWVANETSGDSRYAVDTGAIGNFGADGGAVMSAEDIIPNLPAYGDPVHPLNGFNVIWPLAAAGPSGKLTMQTGANAGETIQINLYDVRTSSIGLTNVDLVNQASEAIERFDDAVSVVSEYRAEIGAMQNRLEHILSVNGTAEENLTASETRIRDLDMASEMMAFTKRTILQQASSAMLAQANNQPQGILQLLRA